MATKPEGDDTDCTALYVADRGQACKRIIPTIENYLIGKGIENPYFHAAILKVLRAVLLIPK